jgi:hypothetical protein
MALADISFVKGRVDLNVPAQSIDVSASVLR